MKWPRRIYVVAWHAPNWMPSGIEVSDAVCSLREARAIAKQHSGRDEPWRIYELVMKEERKPR